MLLDTPFCTERANGCVTGGSVFKELDRPMLIIGGYVQLLRNFFKDDKIPDSYLDTIAQQIDRMEKLAQKMAAIAHEARN
jgi:signal transduction histidine kinase